MEIKEYIINNLFKPALCEKRAGLTIGKKIFYVNNLGVIKEQPQGPNAITDVISFLDNFLEELFNNKITFIGFVEYNYSTNPYEPNVCVCTPLGKKEIKEIQYILQEAA